MTAQESKIVHAAIAVSISAQRIGFGSFDKIPSEQLHESVNEYISSQEQLVDFKQVVSVLKKNWPWFKFSAAALAEYLGIEYIP